MLEVRHLTKRYPGLTAVDDVSFEVRPGEVLAYLGPNGSGKTTTFNMLAGLTVPNSGEILFDGLDCMQESIEYRSRLGLVPEEASLYTYLSGSEYLRLVGQLRSIEPAVLERRITALLDLLNLHAQGDWLISSYSKGMKQKILLAAALLHDPDLLILDEPFTGLDVHSNLILRHVVRELAAAGKTILYSSHVLEQVEKVCTHVLILYKGRIRASGTVEQLRDLLQLPSLEEIFSQLVLHEDTEQVARDIARAMKS